MAAEAQTLLQVGPGGDEVATIERHDPHGQMALQHEDRVALALRQVEELLAQLVAARNWAWAR